MKRLLYLLLTALPICTVPVAAAAPAAPTEASAKAAKADVGQKLDLNRASAADLVAVPGIGPRMAEAIVAFRAKKGPFSSVNDLLQVRGIKEKKLKQIAPYLEVQPAQSSAATPSPR